MSDVIQANTDVMSGNVIKKEVYVGNKKEKTDGGKNKEDKKKDDDKVLDVKTDNNKMKDYRYKNLIDLIINNDDSVIKIDNVDNIVSIDDLLFYNEKLTKFYLQFYNGNPEIANNVITKWRKIKDTKENASQIYKELLDKIGELQGNFDKETLIKLMNGISVSTKENATEEKGEEKAASEEKGEGKTTAPASSAPAAPPAPPAPAAPPAPPAPPSPTPATGETEAVLVTSQSPKQSVAAEGAVAPAAPPAPPSPSPTPATGEAEAVLVTSQSPKQPVAAEGAEEAVAASRAVNNGYKQTGGNFKDLKDYISKYKENIDEDSNINAIASKYEFDNINSEGKIITPDNAFSRFINMYSDGITSGNKDYIIKAVDDLDNDPTNPLKSLEIKYDDRIVFIAITFVIRYVTLLLIMWCIEIDTIKSFNDAFMLFTFIYIVIFWFIVMIINANISQDSDENSILYSIKSVLYYFYFKINGIERLITHTILILLLLTIPVIIKAEKKENSNEPLTYEEKIKLTNILSLFTIFMWVFTSIIATKF